MTTTEAYNSTMDYNLTTEITTVALATTVDPVAEFFKPLKLWFENIMNIYYYIVIPFFILICIVAPLIYILGNSIQICMVYRERKKKGLPMKWKKSKTIFEKAKERKIKTDLIKKEERKQKKIQEKKAEWKRLYGNRAHRMTMDERIAYLGRYHFGFIVPSEEEILEIQRKALIRQFDELDKKKPPADSTSYHALHSPVPEDLANTEKRAPESSSPTITETSRKISLADVQIVDEEIKKMENEKQKAENKEKKNVKNMMLKMKVTEESEVDEGTQAPKGPPALSGRFKSLVLKHAQMGEEDAKNAADGKEPVGTEEQRELRSRLKGIMSRMNSTEGGESDEKPTLTFKITSFATLVNVNQNKKKQKKRENPNDKWRRIRMLGNEQEKKRAMEEMKKNAQEEEAKNIQKQQEDDLEKRWQLQFNYFALVQNAVQQIRHKETRAEDDFVPANARSLIVPEKCYKMSRRQRKAKDNRFRWVIKLHYKDQNRKRDEPNAGKDQHAGRDVDASKSERPLEVPQQCMETSRYQRILSEKKFIRVTLIEIPAEKLPELEACLQKEKQAAVQMNIENEKTHAENAPQVPSVAMGDSAVPIGGERDALSPVQVPDQCYNQPNFVKKREETQHNKPLNVDNKHDTDNDANLSEQEKQDAESPEAMNTINKESKERAIPSFLVVDDENGDAPLNKQDGDTKGGTSAAQNTDIAAAVKKVKKVKKVVKKFKKKNTKKEVEGLEPASDASKTEAEKTDENEAVQAEEAGSNPTESFV